ncbi:MAG TPA: MFS transporter, partial [Solirubrobacter sp.]|nr:MFS transporter [Solirubrobacter sp.]
MESLRRALVAVAAGLALADASIVALALPPILVELHTTISGVAAVVGVYALVLAVCVWPAARLRIGPSWGFALFAAGSVGCAAAGSLELLLAFRALQAAGAAAALTAAFAVLDAGRSRSGRRLWIGAALIGTAAGPALGGALTEAFDWRAIFIVQAPLAAAAALVCVRRAAEPEEEAPSWRGWTAPTAAPESGGGLWAHGGAGSEGAARGGAGSGGGAAGGGAGSGGGAAGGGAGSGG